jgi:hypothetical protein
MNKITGIAVALVLAFCAGATTEGLWRGAETRRALARADSLQVQERAAVALADSLAHRAATVDTVRGKDVVTYRAVAQLAPIACAPVIKQANLVIADDSAEIADLHAENAALRKALVADDSANTALRDAAKHADGALFHLFGLPVEKPSIALGVTPDAPLKPKLFVSLISVGF